MVNRETHGPYNNLQDYSLFIYQFNDELTVSDKIDQFPISLSNLFDIFEDSNWKKSKMPKPLKFILENVTVTWSQVEEIK